MSKADMKIVKTIIIVIETNREWKKREREKWNCNVNIKWPEMSSLAEASLWSDEWTVETLEILK